MKAGVAEMWDQLEGVALADSIEVTEKGITLPKEAARLVKLENWDVLPDTTLTAGNNVDVLWGYKGIYSHWLRAGGNTELLPISNLSDICLRTRPGQSVTIFYSFYR